MSGRWPRLRATPLARSSAAPSAGPGAGAANCSSSGSTPRTGTRGVASRLLRQFEQRAASRGCDVYYLTTLSFQAPEFYRKRGYASIAEISGYPDGITKYLMYKEVPIPRAA